MGAERLRDRPAWWEDRSWRVKCREQLGSLWRQDGVPGSHSLGSGSQEGWESWRMDDGGSGLQDSPAGPWGAEAAGKAVSVMPMGGNHSSKRMGPLGLLIFNAVFLPPDHNFQTT